MEDSEFLVKKIEKFGRLTIPANWRKMLGETVILMKRGNEIRLVGLKNFKLTDLLDSIKFEGELEDLKDV
ncbi:MAG: hypothetical protein ACP6IP_10705 [Candidatus Njordarchaeia archaeon]